MVGLKQFVNMNSDMGHPNGFLAAHREEDPHVGSRPDTARENMYVRHVNAVRDYVNDPHNPFMQGVGRVFTGTLGGLAFGVYYTGYKSNWRFTNYYSERRLITMEKTNWSLY